MKAAVRVDPVDLFMSSNHLEACRAEHTEVHQAANAIIESAAGSGWVGSSAAALTDQLAHLEGITSHISDELVHHRDAFRQIGHNYQNLDEDAAATIIRTRNDL